MSKYTSFTPISFITLLVVRLRVPPTSTTLEGLNHAAAH